MHSDGTVYIFGEAGNIFAINANGSQRFRFTTSSVIKAQGALASDGTFFRSARACWMGRGVTFDNVNNGAAYWPHAEAWSNGIYNWAGSTDVSSTSWVATRTPTVTPIPDGTAVPTATNTLVPLATAENTATAEPTATNTAVPTATVAPTATPDHNPESGAQNTNAYTIFLPFITK